MAGGKFEDRSHDELYDMVATAKPGALTDVGAALSAAFDDISAIAEELKAHAERVHWEGEGADAFREWGREVAKQTHKMAEYTLLVGVHMTAAGQGLTEVKAAMPAPTAADDKKHKNDAEKAAADKHHLEALRQMDKLDSYYETAYTEIKGLEEPNFPLLPDLGAGWGDYSSGTSGGASSSTGGTQGAGHVTPFSVTSDPHSAAKAALPAGIGNEGHVGNDVDLEPDTNTIIDSTDTLPTPDVIDRTRQQALPPDMPDQQPGPVGPGGLRGPRPPFLPPSAPPPVRGGGRSMREPLPPYQGAAKQPRPTSLPRTGLPDGIHGGQQARPPGQTNTPRIPRGRVIGEEQGLMKRGPMGPATHGFKGTPSPANGGPGRRLASEPGGTVDSPRGPNNANGQRLPKGTVVGDEHGIPPRRGPLGTGGVPADGGAHAPGSSGGQGRRLASESGGPVSGTRSGRGTQSEFTPGGSGLVRGNQVEPESTSRSGRAASNGYEPSGSRPDYLQEDEESWSGGRRDTVPPVIE
ncbi:MULTISPECIES: WXG100 family type VII secretion target [Streptomyces violaceusniger group]|uniref:WXG100 family type VII secretion target n=2 Tax=Streptomyces javensis TaxID=114698 RepID=A0ABP4I462_9ACTN|nr:hypothetical protein [Streptomyces javensis]MBI0312382.1 hypothetical protein [Streptomyces javensis]